MIPQGPQPLLDAVLGVEIRQQQEDGEEEEECSDQGPFDNVGRLYGSACR
jgi:hypothetical protein